MKKKIQVKVPVPAGVTATVNGNTLTVKGPKGELAKELLLRNINMTVENNAVLFVAPQATQREKKAIFTAEAHAANMMFGVKEGYEYVLKICSGHFPISVTFAGGVLTVKNFIGEVVPRKLKVKPGVSVVVEGEIIKVNSPDVELAGQTAGDIEKMCRRPAFDIRVFQDGIYIISKAGKAIE